jgi:hypothetical protein
VAVPVADAMMARYGSTDYEGGPVPVYCVYSFMHVTVNGAVFCTTSHPVQRSFPGIKCHLLPRALCGYPSTC